MGIFRRKRASDQPEAAKLPVQLQASKNAAGRLTFDIDGIVQVDIGSVAEAKSDLRVLQAKRKEFMLERRAVDNDIARLRSENQIYLGLRGSNERVTKKGRGISGFLFGDETASHEQDRREHAQALLPYESKKVALKNHLLAIDRAISRLQTYIAEQS